jgi:hypothetical protein
MLPLPLPVSLVRSIPIGHALLLRVVHHLLHVVVLVVLLLLVSPHLMLVGVRVIVVHVLLHVGRVAHAHAPVARPTSSLALIPVLSAVVHVVVVLLVVRLVLMRGFGLRAVSSAIITQLTKAMVAVLAMETVPGTFAMLI